MKPTLSSIVAPTRSVFTATGTETLDPISPKPSPPNTAPKAPSPSFLLRISFSLGISQSSKANIAPVELASRRPSSRRRFLVSRYFEEYLAIKKSAQVSWNKYGMRAEISTLLLICKLDEFEFIFNIFLSIIILLETQTMYFVDGLILQNRDPLRLIDGGTKNAWLIGAV